jgi:hypothetical protein
MRKPARPLVLLLGALLAITPVVGVAASPAGADDATASTIDTSVRAATAWWWYYGVTAAQIATDLAAHHARLTQLKVEDPAAGTFSAVMVANTGPYASAYWWYYGQTPAQVASTLSANNARLVSIDPYVVGGMLYLAVVEVPETGSQARSWQWFYGQTASNVVSDVSAGNWRLIALEPYVSGSSTLYAIIMVGNTGYDSKAWRFEINQPIGTIASQISQGYRITSFAPDPSGGFDAILVASEGEGWWFYYGETAPQIASHLAANHSRLIDIETYVSGSTRLWATVELDNTDAVQPPVNAASKTVDSYAATNGWGAGVHGEYFARIGPTGIGAAAIAANATFRFEPASAIKILYATYAMREVSLHKISLSATITYYRDPADPSNPGVCPDPAWGTPANAVRLPLSAALKQMLDVSDNRITRALAVRFGVAKVNAWASSIGLKSTHIGQPFIGCGFNGGVRNDLTLANAAIVYAGIWNGHLLKGTERSDLLSYLLGGTPSATSEWGKIVTKEAAAVGKSAFAKAFLADMMTRDKGGSYAICDASCASYHIDLTDAGLVVIPFKVKGKVQRDAYAYGGFVNDLSVPCAPGGGCSAETGAWNMLGTIGGQDAASTIAAALRTW